MRPVALASTCLYGARALYGACALYGARALLLSLRPVFWHGAHALSCAQQWHRSLEARQAAGGEICLPLGS